MVYGYDVFTDFINAGLTDISQPDIPKTYTKILGKIGKKTLEQIPNPRTASPKVLFGDIYYSL